MTERPRNLRTGTKVWRFGDSPPRPPRPGEENPVERNRQVRDAILARRRREELEQLALSGDPQSIAEHFKDEYPEISSDEGYLSDVIDRSNHAMEQGADNCWQTYEDAARDVIRDFNLRPEREHPSVDEEVEKGRAEGIQELIAMRYGRLRPTSIDFEPRGGE